MGKRVMTTPNPKADADSLPTCWSLLTRLKNWDDQESWKEFFESYWRLIYRVAIKAGLSQAKAQDVVQETIITVAKNLKDFKTDPAHGSFKVWLLQTTRWRITNQFKKRRPDQIARAHRPPDDTRQTSTVDRLPADRKTDLDSLWDAEWQEHQAAAAMERLKHKVKPKHFQIFFLHVIRQQSSRDVANSLGVNVAQVYLVKHRLMRQFQREIESLRQQTG